MRSSRHISCVMLLGLAFGCPSRAQDSQTGAIRESSARPAIDKLIQQSGADVSVAFRSLDGAQELLIDADKPFEDPLAAKIPVMVELYAEVEARELRWSDILPVHANFRSAADGSTYRIDPSSDRDLSKSVGKTMTLRRLCDAMIADDSDLAADLLIEKLGVDRIRQRIHAMGGDGMEFAGSFGDSEAAAKGLKNLTTARALMIVLWALAGNRDVSADASMQMLGLIAHSGLQGGVPGVTPAQAPAPRRPPALDRHDATVIIGAHSFVLVTDVRGISDPQKSAALVAQISHALSAAM
ncbi:MAG TPA: serine hydrolase [Candidatus Acidoferrales bacterium]|nr:serine hydrolase [Candidatus Acidoferrales bacterium]